jgi:hypothetical protein
MAASYKPGPQAWFLVAKMSDSEKKLLEAVQRLSEKMDVQDKCLTSLGTDLSKVQSQMDLSMKSIQVLQQEQIKLVKAVHIPGMSGAPAHACSDGIMGPSPTPPSSELAQHPRMSSEDQGSCSHSTQFGVDRSHQGNGDSEHRRHWIPKMDFPQFDGTDVRIWLDKCSTYFQLYSIPPNFLVTTASMHLVDRASHWYQSYKHSPGSHTLEHFVVAVSQEFEVNTHRVKTMELLNLKQTSSIEDYKQQFDQLVYHIRLYDGNISDTMLVSQFLLGLK